MNFGKVLREGSFSVHLKNDTKEGIIEEMIDLMVADGRIDNKEAALAAVLEREQKMSTGMQFGVAIPHGKTPEVENLVTALALKKEGVDFDALDGEPSRIFVMTVSSTHRTGPHIQYLSEISKALTKPSVRERLLECETVDEMITALDG